LLIKKSLHKFFNCFLILCFLSVTTASNSMALTVGEERKIGEQLLYQIRLAFPLLDDPDISQYINELGGEVLEVAGFQYFDYHFNIIASSQFNAFAAPSGLVFFYTGLIEKMNHEDELVSVLAHEIGHVVARHIAKGMEKGTTITVASTLLALASLALGVGALSQALLTGSLAAGQAANLHFSRKHEEEADRLAYGWMKKMGRHPHGQEEMLHAMRRITRYTMGNSVPQYLLTHPYPAERLDYVQSLIAYEEKELQGLEKTDDFSFLRVKYRILSLVKDGKKLRDLLHSRLSDKKLIQSEKVMLNYGLSQLDRMENNFESSKKYLQEVIQFYPHKSILLVDLGLVEKEAGNKSRALALFQEAYEKDRNDMWAAFQLAALWLELKEYDKSERYLKEVQAEMPDYSKVYFELGKLKAAIGENANSAYYLAKYNLYEGRLKLAKHNLETALKRPGLDEEYKEKIKKMQKTIEMLEED
jgi:beta-barrel assembly-enhancing protease